MKKNTIKFDHDFRVGDIIGNPEYPKEEAEVLIVEQNWLRVSHPFGWVGIELVIVF